LLAAQLHLLNLRALPSVPLSLRRTIPLRRPALGRPRAPWRPPRTGRGTDRWQPFRRGCSSPRPPAVRRLRPVPPSGRLPSDSASPVAAASWPPPRESKLRASAASTCAMSALASRPYAPPSVRTKNWSCPVLACPSAAYHRALAVSASRRASTPTAASAAAKAGFEGPREERSVEGDRRKRGGKEVSTLRGRWFEQVMSSSPGSPVTSAARSPAPSQPPPLLRSTSCHRPRLVRLEPHRSGSCPPPVV